MAYRPFDLTGKVALVTGGNGGIGFGMVEALAASNADVVIWGRKSADNDAAVKSASGLGTGLGVAYALDDGGQVLRMVGASLSLLPVVGSGLVWLPMALYLVASGALWQGLALIAFGVLVIGLIDNLLRPVLVGRDTRLPDYLVMVATLGGLSTFGINGLVLGPAIAALFVSAWKTAQASRAQH